MIVRVTVLLSMRTNKNFGQNDCLVFMEPAISAERELGVVSGLV
jgi:hypothetical protein